MRRTELNTIYLQARRIFSFQEDKSDPGWMPVLRKETKEEDDNVRFFQKKGTYQGKPAVMTVVGDITEDWNLPKIVQAWETYFEQTKGKPGGVKISPILGCGPIPVGVEPAYFVVQARMDGPRLISNDPLEVTEEEMSKFARLYWQTWFNFPEGNLSGHTAGHYFLERLSKWFKETTDREMASNHFVSKAVSTIFEDSRVTETGAMIAMGYFFSHFGFTDIIVADGIPLIWNSEIVPKPQGAGIAANIWTTLVHGSLHVPLGELRLLQKKWKQAFLTEGKDYLEHVSAYTALRANLLERLIATLLIDIPDRRSPYDNASDREIREAKAKIFDLLTFTLNHF